jgi:hypothetical protein
MPVSSNSCVAKLLREKYNRFPSVLYTIHIISHQLMAEETTQHTRTYTRRNYLQIIRTSCSFLLVSLHFLYFENCSTAHNFELTRARHKLQLPRQRTKPGTDEFITSVEGLQLIRLANAVHFSLSAREHTHLFYQGPTCKSYANSTILSRDLQTNVASTVQKQPLLANKSTNYNTGNANAMANGFKMTVLCSVVQSSLVDGYQSFGETSPPLPSSGQWVG